MKQRAYKTKLRLLKQSQLVGYIIYASTIQYFVLQMIVASRWSSAFSLRRNTISDLGNTSCGLYNERFVCSPWHTLMNISFLLLGAAMISGSLLVYCYFMQTRATAIGFSALVIGGFGVVLVGLFPENSISLLHIIGAALPFLIGNIGVLILGFGLKNVPKWLQTYTIFTGLVALIALTFYVSTYYLKLGEGGIERVVAYPQTIWLVVFGLYGIYHTKKQ